MRRPPPRARLPDDPEVDAIVREAVNKWRFRPYMVDGYRVRVCSQWHFTLTFGDGESQISSGPSAE